MKKIIIVSVMLLLVSMLTAQTFVKAPYMTSSGVQMEAVVGAEYLQLTINDKVFNCVYVGCTNAGTRVWRQGSNLVCLSRDGAVIDILDTDTGECWAFVINGFSVIFDQ